MSAILMSLIAVVPCVGANTDGLVYFVQFADGSSREATPEELKAAAKRAKIAAINTECRARLVARYGDALEQNSRVLGVYGIVEREAMLTGVTSTIDATNTASDSVDAATTIANAEAVAVTWPVI